MFTHVNPSRLLVGLIALALLAGCNFPGAEPITSTLPTYIPPTATPPNTSTPPATQEPDRNSSSGSDACLEGAWAMTTSTLDLFVSSMFPQTTSFLRVKSGGLKLSFANGAFTYSGDYILHVDSGEGMYSEARILFITIGTYHTEDGDRIVFEEGQTTDAQTVECTAYTPQTGLISVDCAGMGIQQSLPLGYGLYLCSTSSLQIEVQSPSEPTAVMFFERK